MLHSSPAGRLSFCMWTSQCRPFLSSEFERYLLAAETQESKVSASSHCPGASTFLSDYIYTSTKLHTISTCHNSSHILHSTSFRSSFSHYDQSLYLSADSSLTFRFMVHLTPFPYHWFLPIQIPFISSLLELACFFPQQSKLLWISKNKIISVGLFVLCVWDAGGQF